MDKVKKAFQDLPFRVSFIIYAAAFTLTAFILIGVMISVCQNIIVNIQGSYQSEGKWYYLTSPDGTVLGEGAKIWKEEITYSEEDSRTMSILNAVSYLCIPVYSIACLILATTLFYRNKMKRPLTILQEAHNKISDNNLDFTISYASKDEMGSLCASFEKMRAALSENNKKMWRQVEQRKQLNAAFAHDLRTPLTVLKGYSEILERTSEAQTTKDTAKTMTKHIGRMEKYVESMSSLQRIEDITPNYRKVQLSDLLRSVTQTAAIVCESAEKTADFQNNISIQTAELDDELILTVVENLVSNAVRYANSGIDVEVTAITDLLTITVKDDGDGFSSESTIKAADPYYTAATDKENHFGLGLYICKMLCKHHGGDIRFGNMAHGAFVMAAFQIKNTVK